MAAVAYDVTHLALAAAVATTPVVVSVLIALDNDLTIHHNDVLCQSGQWDCSNFNAHFQPPAAPVSLLHPSVKFELLPVALAGFEEDRFRNRQEQGYFPSLGRWHSVSHSPPLGAVLARQFLRWSNEEPEEQSTVPVRTYTQAQRMWQPRERYKAVVQRRNEVLAIPRRR